MQGCARKQRCASESACETVLRVTNLEACYKTAALAGARQQQQKQQRTATMTYYQFTNLPK
jgi:hypothetical protein